MACVDLSVHLQNRRRARTTISTDQVARLLNTFNDNQYPTVEHCEILSMELGLSEANIQVWFKNRRARLRWEGSAQLDSTSRDLSNRRSKKTMPASKAITPKVDPRPESQTKMTGVPNVPFFQHSYNQHGHWNRVFPAPIWAGHHAYAYPMHTGFIPYVPKAMLSSGLAHRYILPFPPSMIEQVKPFSSADLFTARHSTSSIPTPPCPSPGSFSGTSPSSILGDTRQPEILLVDSSSNPSPATLSNTNFQDLSTNSTYVSDSFVSSNQDNDRDDEDRLHIDEEYLLRCSSTVN